MNFTDPTGESWLSDRTKGIGGPKFWKKFSKVAKHIFYFTQGNIAYLIGGLNSSRTNKLDWNEERARTYREWTTDVLATAGALVLPTLLMGEMPILAALFTAIGISVENHKLKEKIQKGPPARRNLAEKGDSGVILSEYDYDFDGRIEMTEAIVAFATGARRSQLDFDGNNKIEMLEGASYWFIKYNTGYGNEWDVWLMYHHFNKK